MVTAILMMIIFAVLLQQGSSEYHKLNIPKNSTNTFPTDCSEFKDCSSCNDKFECNYLNNQCEERDIFGIKYYAYDPPSDYSYCTSGTDRGEITLSKKQNETLILGHRLGSSISIHSLCEWIIKTDMNKEITVEINRDLNYYEDIFVQSFGNDGFKEYNSKNMSSCGQSVANIVLYNTTLITIRSK